ncbi:MAG TPA: GAF domain-containing protein, partial [Plasticicumulans sp.]|nr:GAF domain-containing protein [Plasticicumulans sp.]
MNVAYGELDPGLRALVEGTASVTGDAFFAALVAGVAAALGVRWCFVAEFASVRTRVRMLAYRGPEGALAPVEFDLAGTPCEAVLGGECRHYERGVSARYPLDAGLVRRGAEGYLAIPLRRGSGEVLGHLAVFDDRPLSVRPAQLALFQVFGARAAAELERVRTERAL